MLLSSQQTIFLSRSFSLMSILPNEYSNSKPLRILSSCLDSIILCYVIDLTWSRVLARLFISLAIDSLLSYPFTLYKNELPFRSSEVYLKEPGPNSFFIFRALSLMIDSRVKPSTSLEGVVSNFSSIAFQILSFTLDANLIPRLFLLSTWSNAIFERLQLLNEL